jgi:two-component system, NtrC family, sensor histidine kinase PilS
MVASPNLESGARARSLTGIAPPAAAPKKIDPDGLVRKLISVAVARVVIVTLSLGALFAIAQLKPPETVRDISEWEYLLIGFTYLLSLVYAGLLRYRALVTALGYAQIGLDATIVSVLVMMTGGIESVFTVTYVFVVLGAAITLYRKGALAATLGVFFLFGTVVLMQVQRTVPVMPRVDLQNALFAFGTQVVGILVVALLASMLTERLRIADLVIEEKKIDLEQLEELHAAILRSLPAGLMTVDEDLTIRYANESALSILRMTWDQLDGQKLLLAVPFMGRAWNERGLSDHPLLPGRMRERFERSYVSPDGTVMKIGFSFAPLSLGRRSGFIVVFQDVTDIVRLKEAVERAERLATVGKFAAGLAHEVRNPLASMCASIDVLEQSLDPPDAMKRLMGNVVKEADRLNELITQFLSFAKPRELKAKEADLSALVRSVVEMFRHEGVAANLHLDLFLADDLTAAIDEDQVRQVVWNLIRNASEAMTETGGTLTIRTFEQDGEAVLVVRDTGVGLPPEQARSVFDPFFTTKQGGSGLGLAIAYSIVESHGGSMSFQSQVGVGTEVTVRLPTDMGSVDLMQSWDESTGTAGLVLGEGEL